jgi:hypothetical protein
MNKYLVLLCFLSFACDRKEEASELAFEQFRISIPISSDQLNSYQEFSVYKTENNRMLGYNYLRHTLDFFDLDEQIVERSQSLASDGPNALGQIQSLYWHNEDSIFMYERGKLHIVTSKGEKVDSIDLYEVYGNLDLGEPVCNFYFKLNYVKEIKEVLFFMVKPTLESKGKSNLSLITSLAVENKEVKLLPIKHTEHFENLNGHVGFIAYLGFSGFLNEKMIYNFQYESPLYAYSPIGDVIDQSSIHEEKKINELLTQEDSEVFDRHAIENPHFLSPVPDPWKNLIYRFTWGAPVPNLGENGFTEKSSSISVFDSELNLIQEFSLPSYTYQINNWFVNENGLYLNVAHPKNETVSEDFLVFDLFKFKETK